MGIFSGKKKTYVSSVAYNLSGDPADIPDFMQQTILQATLENRSIGESIGGAYLTGNGIKLRNAYRYARDFYTNGLPVSGIQYADSPDLTALTAVLQTQHPSSDILLLTNVVGIADFVWWAEQHLAEAYAYDRVEEQFLAPPPNVHPQATVSYDLEPDGMIRIICVNPDNYVTVLNFRPRGLTRMGTYVHCMYQTRTTFRGQESVVTRPFESGDADGIQVTVVSVGRLSETQETTTRVEMDTDGVTTVITTTVTILVTSRPKYFIYATGSGGYPVLDSWIQDEDLESPYFPAIPVRVNNQNVTGESSRETDLYKTSDKLCKKLGIDLASVSDNVHSNGSVNDIDFAFIVLGVDLNTPTQAGKRYLYAYFEHLRNISTVTSGSYNSWLSAFLGNVNPGHNVTSPQTNVLQIYNQYYRESNYDIKLQWQYIDTRVQIGTVFAGAKIGDVTLSTGGGASIRILGADIQLDDSKLYARKQLTVDTYEELEICGLYYDNYIYRGKSVSLSAHESINDPNADNFIIPLSQQVVRDMSLVHLTQLSGESHFIVFNCYKVVKQKWYQTGIFKIILIIIAVVLMVFFPPAGVAAMAAVIGTAIGVTLLVATIIAAVVTMLAGMILCNLIMKASVKLFGEKWGRIIGAIVSMVVSFYVGGMGASSTSTVASTTAVTAQTILQATTAIAKIYGEYAAMRLTEIAKDSAELADSYQTQMKAIDELTKANLDTSLDMIDIQGYMEASNAFLYESPNDFLSRTLLTGSEICNITNGLITNFVDVGLRLPDQG